MDGQVLDIAPFVVWVIAATQILTLALALWNLVASSGRENARKLSEHEVRLGAHDQRLTAIDLVQRAMPTKDNMHQLELTMERLKGEMATMSTSMSGSTQIMERLEVIVARHDVHLMDGGRR